MLFDDETTTPSALADELGVNSRQVRRWLRESGIRPQTEQGQRVSLTVDQADLVRQHFDGGAAAEVKAQPGFTGASWTVGQLLGTYSSILEELRRRGLVRTNNAPIGDLAEYAASIVYGGTLAPNSEKSYDLTASDGRLIQVKVRNIRPETSPSAIFSVIRSFGFDACIFVLIDSVSLQVHGAFEWTAAEVREFGVHREHTNGIAIRVGQARQRGVDLTDQVDDVWRDMLASV